MEIAFWELAPYQPGATAQNIEAQCAPFMVRHSTNEGRLKVLSDMAMSALLAQVFGMFDSCVHSACL